MPCSSAAATASASRTEPPGWITARAPALAASSTPSANGKNASEATTEPASGARAFDTAMRTESTRDICPAPIPSVRPPAANTMAFDFTCLQTRHAKSRSASSSGVGPRLETTFASAAAAVARSRSWTRKPPATLRISSAPAASGATAPASKRRFFFAASAESASGS